MFFKGSRYEKVETVTATGPDGVQVAYKKIRYITPPRAETDHSVRDGDRLDLLAHRYLRDSERFWRICDANRALWPPNLIAKPGKRILIPTSEE